MRYLVGLVLGLALTALPLRVLAQTTDDAGSGERPQLALLLIPQHLEERLPHQPHEPTLGDEPVLGETLELKREPEPPQVKRAKIGLYTSSAVASGGFVLGIVAGFGYLASCYTWRDPVDPCHAPGWVASVGWTGVALTSIGAIGQVASGILLARRRRELGYARSVRSYRAHWDIARSRLLF